MRRKAAPVVTEMAIITAGSSSQWMGRRRGGSFSFESRKGEDCLELISLATLWLVTDPKKKSGRPSTLLTLYEIIYQPAKPAHTRNFSFSALAYTSEHFLFPSITAAFVYTALYRPI